MTKLCKRECLRERVKRYVVYSNSPAKFTKTVRITLTNPFDVLQRLPEDPPAVSIATTAASSDKEQSDNNENDFQLVTNKGKTKGRKKNAKKYSEKCEKGVYCTNGAQCSFSHTIDELKFFRSGKTKALACGWRYNCRRGDKCRYPHDEKDSFCCYCSKWGHLVGEVKKEKCFKKKPSAGSDIYRCRPIVLSTLILVSYKSKYHDLTNGSCNNGDENYKNWRMVLVLPREISHSEKDVDACRTFLRLKSRVLYNLGHLGCSKQNTYIFTFVMYMCNAHLLLRLYQTIHWYLSGVKLSLNHTRIASFRVSF